MSTWYRLKWYAFDGVWIEPVEVEMETEKFITIKGDNGRRRSKSSHNGDCYYPTFDKAKSALIGRIKEQMASAEHKLANATEALKQAEAMEDGK